MIRFGQTIAAAIAAAIPVLAGTAAHAAPARHHARPAARPWTETVATTPSGSHLIGNPAAKVKLVEFISYTCPHCAHFNQETLAPLRGAYVRPGKVSIEVRNLVRDPIDLTVAMLTNCGDPARFLDNHDLFLSTQERWAALVDKSTDEQRARWDAGPMASRLKSIATDFGFYPMMAGRGYSRAQVDTCLADPAMVKRIVAGTEQSGAAGVNSTPSFMVNGKLTDAHAWAALEPLIKAAL